MSPFKNSESTAFAHKNVKAPPSKPLFYAPTERNEYFTCKAMHKAMLCHNRQAHL